MSVPDELRTAAERLEAGAEMAEISLSVATGADDLLAEAIRETAAKDRAVAALLRAVAEIDYPHTAVYPSSVEAALVVARVVAGDQP